ncbi:haloacid dehalogenase-like hydrolase [Nostoc sp. FACHB-87]|uniref:HAD family hydrolase n=1 Tax=Nostocales TaxID=1161 RepID=UPI0016826D13|nr:MULTISPECIES: haloacid dehalogenase-like hydrolase [Nostocales]MBD2297590.1 haloacid dehalogenase-like hydrolase [Nostoc sp. FACHB-190]MBD2453882.1 haloacid dehalogenase-like hydrolase [Nostoc sp. FACHB-87]MBD2476005.1 haloacid dehalogenase-like hydrolase [Anabaena sp. FACHB-83]MBD2487347.1 haloacid dehalogenase-like hydrolase [Aulosira sp. FACHB-615]
MNFPNINRKTISFFLAVFLSIFCLGGAFSCLPAYAALESWSDTSTNKQAIVDFVNKVIADGISEKDRIAVFDNDGTLWAERPHYFQKDFIKDRLKKSSNVRVSNLVKMTQKEIEKTIGEPISAEGKIILSEIPSTIGITNGQYKTQAHDFLVNTNHNKLASSDDKGFIRFDTPYINLTYQPVIELVNYLKENGFKVYICSGGGIYFVRSFSDEAYGIPSEEVIGSAIKTTYDESNKIDGQGGSLVRKLSLAHYGDQQGKPVGIELFIGKRPLIAVGNSSGDFEMFKYTDSGFDKSLIVLINHDDCEREYKYNDVPGSTHLKDGVEVPDNESLDYAQNHDNWIVVSMKNDFKSIFKSNPSRTHPVCSN